MNSIVSKRQEYAERLNNINVEIAKSVADYNKELHDEIELKVETFRAEQIAKFAVEVDTLQKRLAMLDEMIKEEMPNVKELEEKIQKPDVIIEPIQEEKVEEPIVEEIVVEETPTEETPVEEPTIEETVEEPIQELVIEEIQEQVQEQPIEAVSEEVQEPIIEEKEEVVNNSAAQTLERPGMSSIVLPVRE